MRDYLASVLSLLLAIIIAAVGAATRWPWKWEAWLVIIVIALIAAILMYPIRQRPAPESRAFVGGDASGSTFRNVYTEGDAVVQGNARRALFENVIHRPQRRKR